MLSLNINIRTSRAYTQYVDDLTRTIYIYTDAMRERASDDSMDGMLLMMVMRTSSVNLLLFLSNHLSPYHTYYIVE